MKPHSECCAINSHHQQKQPSLKKNIHFSLMPYGLFERIKKNAKFLLRHKTRTQPILEVQEISGLQEKKKNKVLVTS